jgi:hypothetical protein
MVATMSKQVPILIPDNGRKDTMYVRVDQNGVQTGPVYIVPPNFFKGLGYKHEHVSDDRNSGDESRE